MSFANDSSLLKRLQATLQERESTLRAMLHEATTDAIGGAGRSTDVSDFKDLADSDTTAQIHEVTLEHAATELGQVHSALRRLQDGHYGLCTACADPIDEGRLLAMPAAPLCTDCQAALERAAGT